MSTVRVAAVAVLLVCTRADARPVCDDGRYILGDAPVQLGEVLARVIVISGTRVAIEDGCEAVPGRLWRTANNTQVRARWRDCPGVRGVVRLRAAIALDCSAMGGTLRARRERAGSAFKAERAK